MKIPKNKVIATLITAFFMLSIIATIPIPSADAQTKTYTNMQDGGSIPLPSGVTPDSSLDTISHLTFNPNPVGVGQPVSVIMWMSPPVDVSRYFNNYEVVITAPDGTTKSYTLKSYYADTTAWMQFTPDQTGTYQIKFNFPGGYFPAGNYTTGAASTSAGNVISFTKTMYYKPSQDGPYNLIVQNEAVATYPSSPLPTEYWTRPIDSSNREWWSIAGWYPATGVKGQEGNNWPDDTNTYMSNYCYIPYTLAPDSSHILWKRQTSISGIIGSVAGALSFSTGMPSTGVYPSIIYAGRCYDTITKSVNGVSTSFWECYDLRTGEMYWQQTGVPAAQWVIYEAGFGATPGAEKQYNRAIYLATISSGRLIKYDPYTGAVAQNISIAPLTTGTFYADTDWAYFYTVQTLGSGASRQYRLINWTVHGDAGGTGVQINTSLRVISNITWPFSSLGTVDYERGIACNTVSTFNEAMNANLDANITAVKLETGQILWSKMANLQYEVWPSTTLVDQGKIAIRFEDGRYYCWDINTGEQLWKSEVSSWPWGIFGAYGTSSYGGNIITGQYDGVAAYNWTTGKLSWLYQATAEYPYESMYNSSYSFFSGSPMIADGKVYMINSEHTPTQPLTRGWSLHCINASTGKGIWNMTMGAIVSNPVAISDGYVVTANAYDGYMYVIGKGQSATTITAPDKAVTLGDCIVIKGTVTDKSAAQPGTACVSDQSMSEWMEYLHMQESLPTNVEGVHVSLDVTDGNGNYRHIGDTTTDVSGTFSYLWQPDIAGKYTVTATFAGTNSYASSWAETSFAAVNAATTATPQATQTPSAADLYFIPAIAGLFVAVIAVGLLIILMLKKKP
jgi:outer membrane protein assembly factor BamB